MPATFRTNSEYTEETWVSSYPPNFVPTDTDGASVIILTTKRDKDFDPANYIQTRHDVPLTGSYGCSGYKCETYAAPERTIPARTEFMLGKDSRGHLCIPCYQALKEKYATLPPRIQCMHCGVKYIESSFRETLDPRYRKVCEHCVRDYFLMCADTDGGLVLRDNLISIVTSREGEAVRRRYASRQWANRHWFRGNNNWYETQEEADREMFAANRIYRDDRLARHTTATLFSYGTNIIRMHGFPSVTPLDSLCFGVELEMQPNEHHTHMDVVGALGGKWLEQRPYILCADSSIGSAGVEMITLPYTLTAHKSNEFVQWDKLLKSLRSVAKSGAGTTACGMHVHINRRALSHLQMGKMLIVINAPEMQELIVTIAQRSSTAYARRFFKKITDGGQIIGQHSDALNMSNSKGTVELRIFRGNLRYERVMKNLEFAHALCVYAQDQSIQKVHLPDEFLSWLHRNHEQYPNLIKFLAEEYRPLPANARTAARIRKAANWDMGAEHIHVKETKGDI